MDEHVDEFEPWTAAGRQRVLDAGAALAEAVLAHAQVVAEASGPEAIPAIFSTDDVLHVAAVAYADAQFDYTGTVPPLGLATLSEDEAGADEDDEESDEVVRGITVLQRADYAMLDEASVLAAGRAAYKLVWPDDTDEAAVADVTHLGRALYQIAHAHGWASLDEVDGMRPLGAAILIHRQDEPLAHDPDEWPENLFDVGGDLLYGQQDSH